MEAAPENFIVIRSLDRRSALLVWDGVVFDTEEEEVTAAEYEVHMSDRNNGLDFGLKKTVAANTTSLRQFTDIHELDPDVLYSFKVLAKAPELVSSFSVEETDI